MKSLLLSLTFLVSSAYCFSQVAEWPLYKFPEQLPDNYKVDAKADFEQIVKEKLVMPDVDFTSFLLFAETVAYEKKNQLRSGRVFLDWTELEDYLNEILQLLIPPQVKYPERIHVYPTREPFINAYAMHDGTLFFNIGFLEYIKDEASLAIVLAHELAHYIHHDGRNFYLRQSRLNYKQTRTKSGEKKAALMLQNMDYSRGQELVADSVGYIMAYHAGYDLYSGFNNFSLFDRTENAYRELNKRKKKQNKYEQNLLATHPATQDRVDMLRGFINRLTNKKHKSKFVVSEEKFKRLQLMAKYESCQILLNFNNYHECLEQAFINHLLEPQDPAFLYYLAEGIRRVVYVDSKLKSQRFLSVNYPGLKRGVGVLADVEAFISDSAIYKRIHNKELLDSNKIAFKTYGEAFEYFSDKAIKAGVNEVILSKALWGYKPGKKNAFRDSLLMNYIKAPGTLYRKFARAMLDNRLISETNTREIVLMNTINFVEDHEYGYHNRQLMYEDKQDEYVSTLRQSISNKFPEKEIYFIPEQLEKSIPSTMAINEILSTAIYIAGENREAFENGKRDRKKMKMLELFILQPKFWSYINENNVKAIEYIDVTALDDQTHPLAVPEKLINPVNLVKVGFQTLFYPVIGSRRYAYKTNYCSLQLIENRQLIFVKSDVSRHKLTPSSLSSTAKSFFRSKNDFEKEVIKSIQKKK